MPSQVHSDDVKAAVLAALLTGESIRSVSRQYKVGPSTIRRWRADAGLKPGGPLVTPEKKRDLGVLIADYLVAGLATLAAQARAASDEAWIKGQSADSLAIFHGVLADKLVGILSSFEPADRGN